MQLKLFTVPIKNLAVPEGEMNAFLRGGTGWIEAAGSTRHILDCGSDVSRYGLRVQSPDGAISADPGGIQASSRWLSVATPPESNAPRSSCTPEGCQLWRDNFHPVAETGPVGILAWLASLPGCKASGHRDRWYRCAQPPAKCWDASGIESQWVMETYRPKTTTSPFSLKPVP